MRVVAGIPVDRAKLRWTATRAVVERLYLGVELNPLDEDFGPLVNWRALDETERWPALIVGTSSDRIGTPSGRAYYGTLSKDLERWLDVPVGAYVGAAFGEHEDEWREIAGLRVRWDEEWSTSHMWDGVNAHHLLEWTGGEEYRLGLIAVEQDGTYYVGATVGTFF